MSKPDTNLGWNAIGSGLLQELATLKSKRTGLYDSKLESQIASLESQINVVNGSRVLNYAKCGSPTSARFYVVGFGTVEMESTIFEEWRSEGFISSIRLRESSVSAEGPEPRQIWTFVGFQR